MRRPRERANVPGLLDAERETSESLLPSYTRPSRATPAHHPAR
jgi:hypothetical protein